MTNTTNDCTGCPVSAGTHKPADAVHTEIAEPSTIPAWLETLAASWDGCMYDAPGEMIDIGVSIRAAAPQAAQMPEATVVAEVSNKGASAWDVQFTWPVGRFEENGIHKLYTEAQLRAALAATPAAPAAVEQIKANCYSSDDGDTWRDCPDDLDLVDGLKLGDTFELQASIRSWSETFRVTKVPDGTSDDYEVELVSSDAPLAQPRAAGVPAAAPDARDGLDDTALLDFIQSESWDLRSIDMPTGAGDGDVHWQVIEHHMAAPHEREVGRSYSDDPREAIRDAVGRLTNIAAQAGKGV